MEENLMMVLLNSITAFIFLMKVLCTNLKLGTAQPQ